MTGGMAPRHGAMPSGAPSPGATRHPSPLVRAVSIAGMLAAPFMPIAKPMAVHPPPVARRRKARPFFGRSPAENLMVAALLAAALGVVIRNARRR
ncbi:hypothetical protein L1787_09055 [Acuticoccus sp. M5D2P5]|uniref:hypothetical protein n=1 Tax=Acuticoccus kalidii TaxID=2910977 RepID=UPI001F28197B|nr:hypothetical protein [Acuticoccus kalidii]MCF3933557.1 hypothetical protein [Acuticoccus kalidii]